MRRRHRRVGAALRRYRCTAAPRRGFRSCTPAVFAILSSSRRCSGEYGSIAPIQRLCGATDGASASPAAGNNTIGARRERSNSISVGVAAAWRRNAATSGNITANGFRGRRLRVRSLATARSSPASTRSWNPPTPRQRENLTCAQQLDRTAESCIAACDVPACVVTQHELRSAGRTCDRLGVDDAGLADRRTPPHSRRTSRRHAWTCVHDRTASDRRSRSAARKPSSW